jgi:hypothetical protein
MSLLHSNYSNQDIGYDNRAQDLTLSPPFWNTDAPESNADAIGQFFGQSMNKQNQIRWGPTPTPKGF